MITIELNELYGMENEKELMNTIQELKAIGMTDEEIQECLNRSKEGKA